MTNDEISAQEEEERAIKLDSLLRAKLLGRVSDKSYAMLRAADSNVMPTWRLQRRFKELKKEINESIPIFEISYGEGEVRKCAICLRCIFCCIFYLLILLFRER